MLMPGLDKRELFRQSIHIFFGSIIIFLFAFFETSAAILFLSACFVFGSIVSFLIFKGYKVPFFSHIINFVERDYEKHLPGQGALIFFLSIIIVASVFQSKEIVFGSLVVFVFGDGFSTLVGKNFGKTKIVNGKTLEGSLAFFAVSFVLLSFFFSLFVSVIAAIAGVLAELLPVDDNFTIPVASAFVLSALL